MLQQPSPFLSELKTHPISHLRGVGPVIEQHLARLKIFNVQDMLFHLPDFTKTEHVFLPLTP